jgi:cell division protein FtsB
VGWSGSRSRTTKELESQIRHVHGPQQVLYEPHELIVVCLVRDGRPYVRSFVEHYLFSLGVKHIVFLDNGSVDGTLQALCSYEENVTVLQSTLPFKEYQYFLKRYLITRYGRGRWCLYVDIDELFEYPYSEVIGLSTFLGYLSERSYTAVVAQMLDMFPEEPVLHDARREDEPLKELHRFYDISNVTIQDYYPISGTSNTLASEEIEVYRDGIQKTLFERHALLTKHPLMFVDDEIVPMNDSSHWVGGARVADVSCVLFHYKFIGDFYERVLLAVREENRVNNSAKYKKYLEVLEQDLDLRIKKETARELDGVDELVDNGFLVVSGEYMALVDAEERKSEASAPKGALSQSEPRRLVNAFSKVQTRSRTLARRAQDLAQSLERQVQEKERLQRKNQHLERRNRDLGRRNQNLERQMQEIQGSRSWRLLGKLGLMRARLSGEKEKGG